MACMNLHWLLADVMAAIAPGRPGFHSTDSVSKSLDGHPARLVLLLQKEFSCNCMCCQLISYLLFLLHDAMLAWYMLSVCLCVCVCVCGQTGLVSLGRQPV